MGLYLLYGMVARPLVSIWCFFAAIVSLLIYVHLRFRTLGGFPTQPPFPPAIARGTVTGQE